MENQVEAKFKELQTRFGSKLPEHPSDFFNQASDLVTPAFIKKFNTGNNVRAYNIFKEKYYEFISSIKVEKTAAEKLAELKAAKETAKEVLK